MLFLLTTMMRPPHQRRPWVDFSNRGADSLINVAHVKFYKHGVDRLINVAHVPIYNHGVDCLINVTHVLISTVVLIAAST